MINDCLKAPDESSWISTPSLNELVRRWVKDFLKPRCGEANGKLPRVEIHAHISKQLFPFSDFKGCADMDGASQVFFSGQRLSGWVCRLTQRLRERVLFLFLLVMRFLCFCAFADPIGSNHHIKQMGEKEGTAKLAKGLIVINSVKYKPFRSTAEMENIHNFTAALCVHI